MVPNWYITEVSTLGLNLVAKVLLTESENELYLMAWKLNVIGNK
jgi:hypothetical protein